MSRARLPISSFRWLTESDTLVKKLPSAIERVACLKRLIGLVIARERRYETEILNTMTQIKINQRKLSLNIPSKEVFFGKKYSSNIFLSGPIRTDIEFAGLKLSGMIRSVCLDFAFFDLGL